MSFKILSRLASLVSASFFVNASNAAITTMIGIAIAQRGGNQSDVSLIAACYSLGFLAGCLLSPRFIAKFGYIRAFTASAAILTITIIALDLFEGVTLWAILRFTMGSAVAAVTAIADAWINGKTPDNIRGRVIALYSIVLGLAALTSQSIFVLYNVTQEDLVLNFAIVMNVAVILVALTTADTPNPSKSLRAKLLKLTSVSVSANVAAFTAGFMRTSIMAVLPFYLTENGVETGLVAAAIAAYYLGRLLFQWPIGVLADRVDRRSLLTILSIAIMVIISLSAMPGAGEGRFFSGDAGPWGQSYALLLMVLLGGTVYPLYSVASGLAFGRAGDKPFVEVSTTLLILDSVGAVVGPIIIVLITPVFGIRSLHICVFLVAAIAAATGFIRRISTTSPDDKITGIVDTPQTSIEMTQAAAEISEAQITSDEAVSKQ